MKREGSGTLARDDDVIRVAYLSPIKESNDNIGGADIHTNNLLNQFSNNRNLDIQTRQFQHQL